MNQTPLVYLRGEFIPATEASIAIYDAGIVIGATVTDLARTFKHELFRLEDHVQRFYRSCKYARIQPRVPLEETLQLSRELVRRNCELISDEQEIALVWFITPGEFSVYAGGAGMAGDMEPTFCMHTFPLPFQVWQHYYTQGVHVITPSTRHVPPQCVDPKIKCRSRMHWWLADQETHLVDPKAITLCLDLEGNVTETSGSNFLIVQNGAVVQPSSRNILPGISQQTVREICGQLGLGYEVRDFQVHDVINAEEAFLASTPYCLAPVTKINGVTIGDGTPGGPVFRKILTAWSAVVGLDIQQQITGE
ncbi:MAG: aminotransferase class IV [Armatimonadetes bacterium]|nr:aminotransferase class IV [Armatimonadota bacterium]